jgi:hypothetical protein
MAITKGQIVNLTPEQKTTREGKPFTVNYISLGGKKLQITKNYQFLMDCKGKWYEVEYDENSYNKITAAHPVEAVDTPSSDQMTQDFKLSEKELDTCIMVGKELAMTTAQLHADKFPGLVETESYIKKAMAEYADVAAGWIKANS